jgi:hypothetical protein
LAQPIAEPIHEGEAWLESEALFAHP